MMPQSLSEPLLRIDGLSVNFHASGQETVHAVREVSLSLQKGEVLAVLGESGSGKSVLWRTVLGLIPANAEVVGNIAYAGRDLRSLSRQQRQMLRQRDFGIVFQNPIGALNPTRTVGGHLVDRARHVGGLSRSKAVELAEKQLVRVGLGGMTNFGARYPHQISGGQAQRVLIAIATLLSPTLLVADEPTTALDATLRAGILDDLRRIGKAEDCALVIITHDVSVAARIADRVIVMYAGRIVEVGETRDVLRDPLHPYASGLLQCVPSISEGRKQALNPIPGSPPMPTVLHRGCSFNERCPSAVSACESVRPSLIFREEQRQVACHLHASEH